MPMKSCQLLAKHTLDYNIPHYHASLTNTPDVEILEKYKGRNGFFIKKFLIGAEFNENEWRTPWNAIKKDVWGFEGKPVVLTPARDHPRVSVQDDYAVGEIIDVGLDETKQIAWQVSQIFNKKAQKLIREKKVRYGSPTVLKYSDETTVENKLGNGRVQTTLNRFIPAHDALVEAPAYGKQVDHISAICDGNGVGCSLKLMEVSASVNSDNVDQLTIVPFVKKTLKANFKEKTLREMVEYSKNTRQGSSESCISRKISILSDENPDWNNDHIIAVAYAQCRKNKTAEIEKMILGDLTPEITSTIQNKTKLVNKINDLEDKIISFKADDKTISWITVKGNHIPIKAGETKESAIKKFLDDKNSKVNKKEYTKKDMKINTNNKITSKQIEEKITPEKFSNLLKKYTEGFGKIEDLTFKDERPHLFEFDPDKSIAFNEENRQTLQMKLESPIILHAGKAYALKGFRPDRNEEMVNRFKTWSEINNPKFLEMSLDDK